MQEPKPCVLSHLTTPQNSDSGLLKPVSTLKVSGLAEDRDQNQARCLAPGAMFGQPDKGTSLTHKPELSRTA